MNEFESQINHETIPMDEVERVVRIADAALPNPQPDVKGRVCTWDNPEKIESYGLQAGTTALEDRQASYLAAVKIVGQEELTKALVIMYVLDVETGIFMVTSEQHDSMSKIELESGDIEKALDELMYDMGMYKPNADDWDDFVKLVEDGKTHADTLKALQEELTLHIGQTATNRRVPVVEISGYQDVSVQHDQ